MNKPLSGSFTQEVQKPTQKQLNASTEVRKDYSKIIMKGRRVGGLAPIQHGIKIKPKNRSVSKNKCKREAKKGAKISN